MASFVIHHVAGIEFLKQIERFYEISLTEEQKNQFLLGNLIVDSTKIKFKVPKGLCSDEVTLLKRDYMMKTQEEKMSTHFRNPKDKDLCVQSPIVENFVNKYEDIIKVDFSALGYLYHLYTDKIFFNNLFKESFECLDKNKFPTIYSKNLKFIKILKNGIIYPFTDVFSKDSNISIYNDYTVMNKIILNYYNVSFDFEYFCNYASKNFINPGINEVDYNNITDVLKNTRNYIEQSNDIKENNLNVFDVEKVKLFVPRVVDNFINDYKFILDKIVTNRKTDKTRILTKI